MALELKLGDVDVDVVLKDIKNVHLSVYPPTGRVRISAPSRMTHEAIRAFAVSKLDWIKRKRQDLQDQERETPREYLDRESHYVWGKRYLLTVCEKEAKPSIELAQRQLVLNVRPDTPEEGRDIVLQNWYRDQIKSAVPPLLTRWEPLMGVKVERFFVRQMKTKWGSCSLQNHTIRLNTELAKKPAECLEYVVVHELAHLIERTHNARFVAVMDKFMPQWQLRRQTLNRLPVRGENWSL